MKTRNVLAAVGQLVAFAGLLGAQINLNQSPSRDLGWPQLTVTNVNPNLVEGREFYAPQAVALDTSVTPPILYVSDFNNNRVLGWKNAQNIGFGSKADFVVGQKDFLSTTSLGPGTAFSTGLRAPTGLAVDKSGNLYVVDTGNNRILRFPKPYAQEGQALPDLVIGQTGLSCNTCFQPNSGGVSASTIAVATSAVFVANLAFDPQGNLWFTDAGNNRVLRYPASVLGANASNGPAADVVLGQLDFVTTKAPPATLAGLQSRNVLLNPAGIAFDPSGRLYVTDGFNRGLVFAANLQPPFANGANALRLMGLVIPSSSQQVPPPPINEVQFSAPQGIFMIGNIPAVVDSGNNRILLFDPFEQWPADGTSPHAQGSAGPIGQFGYNAGKANRGQPEPGGATLNQPSNGLATATQLFVVDSGNNRVLSYPLNVLGQNSSATGILGQDDFPFRSANLIEGREVSFNPGNGSTDGGIIVDLNSPVPHLYIADTYNNRVLGYADARKVRPGDKADLVIGQPDFARSVPNYPSNDVAKPNAQSLFAPIGLALDTNGDLFVADAGNGRVLRYPSPFNQPNLTYQTANLVLGQSSFTAQVTDPTDRTMRLPYGVALTSSGGLLVSDGGLNRVVYFPGPTTSFTNGMSASKVFGQPDFNTIATGTDTNQLNTPRHIATDSDDRLYVADSQNNRVMIFDQVPFLGNNPRASTILTGPTASGGFSSPRGLFVNKVTGEIWVTEAGIGRVLRFPKFNDLPGQQNQFSYQISSNAGVAVAQDSFGDLYVGEVVNRISIYYPGLTASNSANSLPNRALAPGTIANVFSAGYNFTDTDTATDLASTWPTVLNDTVVLVAGTPTPISYVHKNQLSILLPMSAPTSGTVEVQVVRQSTGQTLGVGQVAMAPSSPGLFTVNGAGTGQLVANNDDGTSNQPQNPISRGHVVSLFGTGQGFVPNAPPDGQPPTDPVNTRNLPDVWIEPSFVDPANITYSGLAPGMVGVWEISFKVPETTVPNATVQVFVRSNSIASSQAPQVTTIAVKQ